MQKSDRALLGWGRFLLLRALPEFVQAVPRVRFDHRSVESELGSPHWTQAAQAAG